MARKSLIEREKRRRNLVKRNFEKRQELRNKVRDLNISEEDRLEASFTLNKMKRDTSYTRLRNRCYFTGRSRGFLRKFQVSRLVFREMASAGLIPGITKASW